MQAKELTDSDKSQYVNFSATHPSGSFLQSWSWGEFQATQGKIVVRVGVFENDGIVGTAQFLKTKIPHLPGYYLYCPYGPLIEASASKTDALAELQAYLDQRFPDCWFVRFEPKDSLPLSGKPTIRIQPGKTLVTDLEQDESELLSGMHPKTRYNIKVAAKHEVSVTAGGEDYGRAVALLAATSKRQNYHGYPEGYYNSLLTFFKDVGETDCKVSLYRAACKGELAACAIMVDYGNTRTYLFGGSDDRFKNAMAPYALHWQAMTDAKADGLANYDWWGIETATGKMPGFVQFKLKWGGGQVAYPPAMDEVKNKSKYRLYSALRILNRLF